MEDVEDWELDEAVVAIVLDAVLDVLPVDEEVGAVRETVTPALEHTESKASLAAWALLPHS